MFSKNFDMSFDGLEPTTEEKTVILSTLSRLENAAPARSTLKLGLKNTDKGIFGVLSLYSHAGEFHTTATEATLLKQVSVLADDLHSQIEEWKKIRFCEPQFTL